MIEQLALADYIASGAFLRNLRAARQAYQERRDLLLAILAREAPGCYRCHDKKHSTAEGNKIGRNCKTCHTVLAEDEADPEILKQLRP